jgi:hypothetical protein
VQFRLSYIGSLPPQSGNSKPELVLAKHAIRQQIHPQLVDLCARQPVLLLVVAGLRGSPDVTRGLPQIDFAKIGRGWSTWQDFNDVRKGLFLIGEKHRVSGFEFVPLIVEALGATCELDILFLRRERPGTLIRKPKDEYGGDLDNRLKLFLDALRCPTAAHEVPPGATPQADELPFLCLLQDDALITKFQVESDTLLGPAPTPAALKDVHLLVRVTVRFTRRTKLSALLP